MLAAKLFAFLFSLSCLGNIFAYNIRADRTWYKTTVEQIQGTDQPTLLCYEPQSLTRTFFKTWTSVKFFVNNATDFSIYAGDNESHVHNQYEQTTKSWFQVFPYWTQRTVYINPFNRSCIGVVCATKFVANLIVKAFDWCMFSCFVAGALLFLLAPRLSRNFLFHYGSGVMFGVLASVLIFVFVLSRFIPKRNIFYTILFAGLSLSAYLWNYLYDHLSLLLERYHWYFAGYVAISGLLSFGYCFYKGPVVNPRLITVIQWTIQAVAVAMMYFSSQVKEVVLVFVLLLVIVGHARLPFPWYLGSVWYRMFPPKPKLLTEEEFYQQGRVETEKALEELRKFCRSPNCDAWKTVSRMQSPTRFSRWVEGDSDHLVPEEISQHEVSYEEYYDDDYEDYE